MFRNMLKHCRFVLLWVIILEMLEKRRLGEIIEMLLERGILTRYSKSLRTDKINIIHTLTYRKTSM